MLSSQSIPSTTPKPGFPSLCAWSLPWQTLLSLPDPCVPALSSRSGFCSGGSSDPRLSPIRRPPCQHDKLSANSSPALPPVTSHQSQVTISFIIRTSEKHASNPFRIRTSKTEDLKPFRIRTYGKTGEGGPIKCSLLSASETDPQHPSVTLIGVPFWERPRGNGGVTRVKTLGR